MFCMYLAGAMISIAHHQVSIRPPHLERSFFYAVFPSVIGPGIIIAICMGLLKEFRAAITRLVLIFTAAHFAFSALFAMHQYEYISLATPHWLSTSSWILATVCLGYRTDRLLKEHNQAIELN